MPCSRWPSRCWPAIRRCRHHPRSACALIKLLEEASGTFGMAGGQAIDLAAQGKQLDITAGGGNACPQDRRVDSRQRADGCDLPAHLGRALLRCARRVRRARSVWRSRYRTIFWTCWVTWLRSARRPARTAQRGKPTHPAVMAIEASQQRVRLLHAEALEALERRSARARCRCGRWRPGCSRGSPRFPGSARDRGRLQTADRAPLRGPTGSAHLRRHQRSTRACRCGCSRAPRAASKLRASRAR